MKILLVSDYATSFGGAENILLMLRTRLRARGHDARIFASSARPGGGESFADYECLGAASRLRTLLQTANPWAFWRLRKVLAEFEPEIVHVMMFLAQLSPLILPLLRRRACLYHAQWYRAICPLGTKLLPNGEACHFNAGAACYRQRCLPLRDWLPLLTVQMRLWVRWRSVFDRVVVCSEAVGRLLESDAVQPMEVVLDGVAAQPARSALAPNPTVFFAGRLVREKGVEVLLEAFSQVEVAEAELLIAGEGPERGRLEEKSRQLGLADRVSFLGHLGQTELARIGAGAWLQVVPSLWAEPFGLVAAEAMMRGTAVIASNIGGLAEIVRHEQTGYLVPAGDAAALAQRLRALLGDRDLCAAMGRAARAVALANFTEEKFVDRIVAVYARLLQREAI
ncbi:MAG: glycosyltransferase family 4 protein [Deltaproteobacteria bacterium]|nr:glycosyltransferase family 4 protein [Deltaproteobacteria bacterium]